MDSSCDYCSQSKKRIISLDCDHHLCNSCIDHLASQRINCPFCSSNTEKFDQIRKTSNKTEPNKPKFLQKDLSSNKIETDLSKSDEKFHNFHSFLLSQKEKSLNILENLKFISQLLKIPELFKEIDKIEFLDLKMKLAVVKKFEIFKIVKKKINFSPVFNANSMIINYIQDLSTVALSREKRKVPRSHQFAWLGKKVSVFQDVSQYLNDHFMVTSDVPIIIQSIGVGLSPCSGNRIKFRSLSIFDDKGTLVNTYSLKENTNEKGRLTYQYNLNPELLIESGVKYRFTYEVQGSCIYIITNQTNIKYKNYQISNGGASLTFYFKFLDIL